jgi:hypothetical protein
MLKPDLSKQEVLRGAVRFGRDRSGVEARRYRSLTLVPSHAQIVRSVRPLSKRGGVDTYIVAMVNTSTIVTVKLRRAGPVLVGKKCLDISMEAASSSRAHGRARSCTDAADFAGQARMARGRPGGGK